MNSKRAALIAGIVVVLVLGLVLFLNTQSGDSGEKPASGPATRIVKEKPRVEPEPRAIEIPEDAIRFDLAYRGLSYEKGTLQYSFAYGYGLRRHEETPFLKAVQERAVDETKVVYFPDFTEQTYSVLEYKDTDVRKLYFDCNGDGQLADDEIFTPINMTEAGTTKRCDFVTSDFMATNREGRSYRFRARLGVSFYSGRTEPQCMWSPACVMEGRGRFLGKDTTFVLHLGDMNGNFMQWGRSQFSLTPSDNDAPMLRAQLSSLIYHDGTFYQLRFEGGRRADDKLTVVLMEDERPTGTLAVAVEGKEDISAGMSYARVSGADDETIQFTIRDNQEFPADTYVLNSGQLSYGSTGAHNWSTDFEEGPRYAITAGNTATVVMGNCDMTVSSVDENQRYNTDVEDRSEFDSDMNIYLSPQVRGAGGELLLRFKKRDEGGQYQEVKPHMTITNAKGQIIESQALEYG